MIDPYTQRIGWYEKWGDSGETHTAKVFIQQLNVSVDDLQRDELIVLLLDGAAEVQAGVSATEQHHRQVQHDNLNKIN